MKMTKADGRHSLDKRHSTHEHILSYNIEKTFKTVDIIFNRIIVPIAYILTRAVNVEESIF